MFKSINPATGEEFASYGAHTPEDVDRALDAAVAAQASWRAETVESRCAVLPRVAKVLRARSAEYARLITMEMGKPLAEAQAERKEREAVKKADTPR